MSPRDATAEPAAPRDARARPVSPDRIAGLDPADLPAQAGAGGAGAAQRPAPAAGASPPDVHLCDINGMILAAPWPIPGVRAAPPGAAADVEVRAAPVPPPPADAPRVEDARILPGGALMLDSPGMRLLVEDGRRATLDAPGIAPDLRRLIVGYSAGTLLLLQRGGLPLHAAAAAGPDGAILLLGDSGAGKSTFAAMLQRRGMALVGDDLIAVDAAGARPGVHRSLRAAKLWQDSARAMSEQAMNEQAMGAQAMSEQAMRVQDGAPTHAHSAGTAPAGTTPAADRIGGLEKTVLAWDAAEEIDFPAPLRAIVRLGWQHPPEAPATLERLDGMQALAAVMEALARRSLIDALGLTGPMMMQAARLVGAVPVWRLDRPRSFAAADAALDLAAGLVRRDPTG